MKKYIYIIPFLLVFNALGAKIDSLVIGSGGGFTGNTTVSKIEFKKLSKGSGLRNYTYISSQKLSKRKTKRAFKAADKILSLLPFVSSTGNVYKFIEIHSGGKVEKLIWSDNLESTKEDIKKEILLILKIVSTSK